MERHEAETAYWRGRIDGKLDSIESRMTALTLQVEHTHICVEKRTRILYLYTGGLGVFIGLLQIAVPFLAKALLK